MVQAKEFLQNWAVLVASLNRKFVLFCTLTQFGYAFLIMIINAARSVP